MGTEMLVVAALEEPEHDANRKRHGEQHRDGAEKAEREQAADDRPPSDTRLPYHRNAQASAIEGLGEIDQPVPRACNGQRGHRRIQRPLCDAVGQTLQCRLLKPVAQVHLIGNASPEIDADSAPRAILRLHREGRSYLRADNQFVRHGQFRRLGRGLRCLDQHREQGYSEKRASSHAAWYPR
jgi:hypothetical protein